MNEKEKKLRREFTKKQWEERKKNPKVYSEVCKKMSKADKGRVSSNKGKKFPTLIGNQHAKGNIPWNKGIPMTKEIKEKMINSLQKSLHHKPNKPEKLLIELFIKNKLPYKFVGDFSLWIGGKNPDFINEDNKIVIEFAGRYWHTEQEMQERIKHFLKFGYKTIIIWEEELKNLNKILEKVK